LPTSRFESGGVCPRIPRPFRQWGRGSVNVEPCLPKPVRGVGGLTGLAHESLTVALLCSNPRPALGRLRLKKASPHRPKDRKGPGEKSEHDLVVRVLESKSGRSRTAKAKEPWPQDPPPTPEPSSLGKSPVPGLCISLAGSKGNRPRSHEQAMWLASPRRSNPVSEMCVGRPASGEARGPTLNRPLGLPSLWEHLLYAHAWSHRRVGGRHYNADFRGSQVKTGTEAWTIFGYLLLAGSCFGALGLSLLSL